MRAVVTGMIGTFSVGGVAWDYGQYALGLERMGFDVYYLEDAGIPAYTFHEETGTFEEDCTYGVQFLNESLGALSAKLKDRWHFRSYEDQTYGLPLDAMRDILADSCLLLNVSGG